MACGACSGAGCSQCSFTSTTTSTLAGSLATRLGPMADCVRNIATDLGTRPYQVWLVWTRWSGGKRGRGVEEVARQKQLLPTPRVDSLGSLTALLIAAGVDEQGTLRVRQISLRYTEDELRGLGYQGTPTPADENFYWEVRVPQADGTFALRRFTVRGVPERRMDRVSWEVELVRASEDRSRPDGTPRG